MKTKTDTDRIRILDNLLTDETGFAVTLRWHNSQDVLTITDGLGNVWGDSMCPEDAAEQDETGMTIRAAIDSIGKKPKRCIPRPVDERSFLVILGIADKLLTDLENVVEGLDPEEAAQVKADRDLISSAREEFGCPYPTTSAGDTP